MTITNTAPEELADELLRMNREDLILSLLIRNIISIEFNMIVGDDLSKGIDFHNRIIQFLSINRPDLVDRVFGFSVSTTPWNADASDLYPD